MARRVASWRGEERRRLVAGGAVNVGAGRRQARAAPSVPRRVRLVIGGPMTGGSAADRGRWQARAAAPGLRVGKRPLTRGAATGGAAIGGGARSLEQGQRPAGRHYVSKLERVFWYYVSMYFGTVCSFKEFPINYS